LWPIWSVYQIYSAVKTKDAETLERKIDFPAVRVSLRNAAVQKLSELYDRLQSQLQSSPVLVARIKQEAASRIVDASLARLVTAVTWSASPPKAANSRIALSACCATKCLARQHRGEDGCQQ
jgi:hypothetical protein